jgi:hypothetical protein
MNRNQPSKSSVASQILIAGSVIWSLLGGGLQILANLQLLVPLLTYFQPLPVLGFGRLVPASSFLLTYGWIGSGLLGVLMILVPRFSAIPFRHGRLLSFGAIAWQLAVLTGFTQILMSGSSGLLSLPFSRSVTLIFFVSFLVLGTGITRGLGGTWKSGPLLPRLYLLGGILAFPLGLGTAELLLRSGTAPGAVQIITQLVWHSFVHHLWLAPMALVLIFQLFPTLTGRAVSSMPLGILAWGLLLTAGGWATNSLASQGPVPSWLQSTGVVASVLLFVAALGNTVLFQPLVEGRMDEIRRNVALRFLTLGSWSYVASYAWMMFLSLPGVRQNTAFTVAWNANQSLFLFSFLGSILAGSIYALLPVIKNLGWPSHSSLLWHFWCTALGTAMTFVGYALAGVLQGLALNDPGVPFSTVASYLRPFLVVILIGQALWLVGQLAFSSLFFATLLKLFPFTAPMAVFPSSRPQDTNLAQAQH